MPQEQGGWERYSELVLDKLKDLQNANKEMRREFEEEISSIKSSLTDLRVIMEAVRLRASFYGALAGVGAGAGIILLRLLGVFLGSKGGAL